MCETLCNRTKFFIFNKINGIENPVQLDKVFREKRYLFEILISIVLDKKVKENACQMSLVYRGMSKKGV